MRCKAASFLIALLACVAFVAGCGSSGTTTPPNTNAQVKVTGTFGAAANVSIPKAAPSGKLAISTPIKGTGAAVASGNSMLADITLYKWSGTTHSLIENTYVQGGPEIVPGQIGLTGLATALTGATVGSRIVAVLPPKYAYGSSGNTTLHVTGSDTLVWVIDVLQQYAPTQAATGAHVSSGGGALPSVTAKSGQAPVVSVPKNSPPKNLSVTTLIKGTGPKPADGDTVVAQYVGVIWRTGKVFSTTWPSSEQTDGMLFSFEYGQKLGVAGFADGLKGVPVGSRVMIVIPPSLGYGKDGNSDAGIKGTDTLVFVVDVLGIQPPIS
jgi:FKBP-type peptidyl-prolyl cis-trans isomerase